MKKVLSMFLCTLLILSALSGCAPSDETPESTGQSSVSHILSVGYARVDITPKESVPLRGLGTSSERMSTDVIDPLYATCIAFSDETGNTILQLRI